MRFDLLTSHRDKNATDTRRLPGAHARRAETRMDTRLFCCEKLDVLAHGQVSGQLMVVSLKLSVTHRHLETRYLRVSIPLNRILNGLQQTRGVYISLFR